MEYFFGLSGVFLAIMLRMLYRAFKFHNKISKLPYPKKFILRNWIALALMGPIFLLCLYVSYNELSVYDEMIGACSTDIISKGLLLIWIIISGFIILISSIIIEKGISSKYISEYKAQKSIIITCSIILLINLFINAYGLLRYAYARMIYTCLVANIPPYVFTRLIGYRLYMSFSAKGERYSRVILNDYRVNDIPFNSIEELSQSQLAMDIFINWGLKNPYIKDCIDDRTSPPRILKARNLASCYFSMMGWKQAYIDSIKTREELKLSARIIIRTYLEPESPESICLDNEIFHELDSVFEGLPNNLFDRVLNNLLYDFQYAWGSQYLNKRNRTVYHFESVDDDATNSTFNSKLLPTGNIFKASENQGPKNPLLIEENDFVLQYNEY
jgi:hypothetical protein